MFNKHVINKNIFTGIQESKFLTTFLNFKSMDNNKIK